LQGIAEPSTDCPDPRTLHRLLGYSPSSGRFHHHENNRLAETIVIVDEASMIDLALMERLVRSLRDDSKLILLGDARQLPSVEAGAVLRDLLQAREQDPHFGPPAVILEKSHRMQAGDPDGRNLLSVARRIDLGETPGFDSERSGDHVIAERPSVESLTFHGVEFVASKAESAVIEEFFEHWEIECGRTQPRRDELIGHVYTRVENEFIDSDKEKLRAVFDYWASFRVLCLTRILPSGSERINEWFHNRAMDLPERHPRNDSFVTGEPVMMQINDYERMIFNGDQGVVLQVVDRARPRPQPAAVFRRSDGFAAFPIESLRSSLALSYAMTVHKAQGSEFDHVALVLPDRDLPINSREILYTALTRARKSAVIVGDRAIFEAGVKRTCDRDSGIVEKLLA
jgi:exodeoxyribonuclease V alpha subunit